MKGPVLPTWRPIAIALLFATLCLSACDRTPESLKRPNMTALSPRLQALFEKTKTVCFGHFTVDVPASATVVFGPADVDFPIAYFPDEGDKVAQHVAAQLIEVEKDRRFLSEGDIAKFTMFGKVIDGAMPGQKLVFGSKNQASYSIYSFIPVGKDLFVQSADRTGSKDEDIKSLNTVASHLRLRQENEAPAEPGACIDGGFVGWQPEFEVIALGVRLKEFPDVHFSIDATKKDIVIESDALEPRLKQAEQDAHNRGLGGLYSRIKTFRRGARHLENWDGFEVLARKPAHEGETDAHEFLFLSQGVPKDPLRPVLDVRLNTGVENDTTAATKPSLTDEEAIALWDKLIGSIRVRPIGQGKHSAGESSKVPLGKLTATGGTCEQTGWWQCTETGNVDGGRRRHFSAGESFPHAVLLGEPNVWQKLKGERPAYKMETVWKLVDYDVVPEVALAAPPSDENAVKDESPPSAT
jgi:hypothetical protein